MPNSSPLAALPYPFRSEQALGVANFTALSRRLDDVTVAQFDTTALRNTAFSAASRTPEIGQTVFIRSLNEFQRWNGSTWVPVLPTGWARGVIALKTINSYWPRDAAGVSSLQPTGTSTIVTDLILPSVTTEAGRTYRASAYSEVDSGPGSAVGAGRMLLKIMSGAVGAAPTITNLPTQVASGSTIAGHDSAYINNSINAVYVWTPGSTTTLQYAIRFEVIVTGGARMHAEHFIMIEDLGQLVSK